MTVITYPTLSSPRSEAENAGGRCGGYQELEVLTPGPIFWADAGRDHEDKRSGRRRGHPAPARLEKGQRTGQERTRPHLSSSSSARGGGLPVRRQAAVVRFCWS